MPILLRTVRALIVGVPFCLAGPAQAAPISFSFSGSFVDAELGSDSFSGSFTYESSTAPIGDASQAFYNAVTAFSVTIGSFYTATLLFPSGAPLSIEVDDSGGLDCDNLTISLTGLTGPPLGGAPLSSAAIFFGFCTDPFASSIPLPTSLPFNTETFAEFQILFAGGPSSFGQLSTLTAVPTIPEPSLSALALIAGTLTLAARRRQKT